MEGYAYLTLLSFKIAAAIPHMQQFGLIIFSVMMYGFWNTVYKKLRLSLQGREILNEFPNVISNNVLHS